MQGHHESSHELAAILLRQMDELFDAAGPDAERIMLRVLDETRTRMIRDASIVFFWREDRWQRRHFARACEIAASVLRADASIMH